MRTKAVEGVFRLDVTNWDPRIEIALCYDGLGGLTQRPILRDVVEELHRKDPKILQRFLATIRARKAVGTIHVTFMDYVSYGIGGGDATAEFSLRSFLCLYRERKGRDPEHLELVREHIVLPAEGPVPGDTMTRERLSLEGLVVD